MTEALNELGAQIEAKRPDCVVAWDVSFGELNIDVTPSNIAGLVEFLKSDQNCKFSSLVDITAVDYPERGKRFDVIYHFLSMYRNQRIRLRAAVREDEMVPSIVDVHPSANWFEREVYDMRAAFAPGEAKENWAILRALSAEAEAKLGYDSLAQLRQALVAEVPHLAQIDEVAEKDGAALELDKLGKAGFLPAVRDFYLTNPVARASQLMAELSAGVKARETGKLAAE